MNGLTRPNLPLMIEIERVVRDADADELLSSVDDADYLMVVRAFNNGIEQISERLNEESYAELSPEQMALADAVLRARVILLLADYLSNLLSEPLHTAVCPSFTQLNEILFPHP